MPRTKEEIQQLMADMAQGYKGKQNGVLYPDDVDPIPNALGNQQLPPQGMPGLVKDPNINYDNINLGKKVVNRIDSPEYKAAEMDLNSARANFNVKPEQYRTPKMQQDIEIKKLALDKIRNGG